MNGCDLASVWDTGHEQSRTQRAGRYVPESMRHPAKMLPAIARRVIATFTMPGEVVLDPMCGIGTTLVEAAHLHRPSIGLEYEQRWAELAARNLELARRQGASAHGEVIAGDARDAATLLPPVLRGKVALVLTSPPYGSSTHGHVRSTRNSGQPGVTKWNYRYSTDRRNLAHTGTDQLMSGFGQILAGCATVMQPGGILAVTVRPIRVRGELVDLPGSVIATAQQAGFDLAGRLVCLLYGLRDGGLVTGCSHGHGRQPVL
jgi:tRNA G10  N-methylase Trm11